MVDHGGRVGLVVVRLAGTPSEEAFGKKEKGVGRLACYC
jgi:hypothetical protein